MEEAKKVLELQSEIVLLKKAIEVNDLLIQETHHRLKNNLQLMNSLLSIQAKKMNSKDVSDFFNQCQVKIIAISHIHENLYLYGNLDKINFKVYVESLVSIINTFFCDNNKTIKTNINIKEVFLDAKLSTCLGLIINELYFNVIKHAFEFKDYGNIFIELIDNNDNYQLKFWDDGIGYEQNIISDRSFGLKLVNGLVKQLNGKLTIDNNLGMKYSITFNHY